MALDSRFPLVREIHCMWLLMVAALCAGLLLVRRFTLTQLSIRQGLLASNGASQLLSSLRQATIGPRSRQASLAEACCVAGLWSACMLTDAWLAVGAISLGAVVRFTLVFVISVATNKQLLDLAPSLLWPKKRRPFWLGGDVFIMTRISPATPWPSWAFSCKLAWRPHEGRDCANLLSNQPVFFRRYVVHGWGFQADDCDATDADL